MMKPNSLATAALLLAIPALPAVAQSAPALDLDEIVVAAGLEPAEAGRTGSTATVIRQEDLKTGAEVRLIDVLGRVPGLAFRATGPLGTQTGFLLRGVPQSNVAVRVDGIDVTDPSGPQVAYDFGGATTAGIGRIEVIGGSQSALYGSRAIGGAITLTTRRATEPGTTQEVEIEAGSNRSLRAVYGLSTRGERGDLAFTLSRVQTDGFSAADERAIDPSTGLPNTEADGYEATRLGFAGGYTFDNGLRLGIAGFAQRSRADYDDRRGGIVADYDRDNQVTATTRGLRSTLEFDAGGIEHRFEHAFFDNRRRDSGTGQFGPYAINFTGLRTTFGYRGATDLGATGRLVFGAERVAETYADASVWGSQRRRSHTDAAYFEYRLAATDTVDIAFAARHDDHSRFGGYTTGRISGVWRASDSLSLRANIANGFRAPSPYELFDTFAGNAALRPETSRSFDIGFEQQIGGAGRIGVTYYDIRTRNLIDYSFTTFAYVQRSGVAARRGVELTGAWDFANGVTVEGSYAHLKARTTATLDSSAWLANAPRDMLTLSLGLPVARDLSALVTVQHAANRVGLADYTLVNATVTYDLGNRTEAWLRVENLFDTQYQLTPGYGTSDRALHVGLRKSF